MFLLKDFKIELIKIYGNTLELIYEHSETILSLYF